MRTNNPLRFNKAQSSNYKLLLSSIIVALLVSSCVSSRLLEDDEYLYAGAKVKVHADSSYSGEKKLEGMLKDETYPLPNRRILGVPVKLWIYSVSGNRDREKGTFVSNTYGERPVLMDDVPIDEVSKSLKTVLKANGFLDSDVKAEVIKTKLGKQQQKVLYHCYVEAPYHLGKITFDLKDTAIAHIADSLKSESLLNTGDRYNLPKLKEERERLDAILKDNGYYYFSPDYLYYWGDSNSITRNIDIALRIKSDINPENLKPWYINQVLVADNSFRDSLSVNDTVKYKGVSFLTGKKLKPKYLRHFISLGEGELLTSDKYSISNKNLSRLSAFKYANMEALRDTSKNNKVNIRVDLTNNELHNFKAEANIVSKSNDFAGPGVELSYIHRNLLGGGEQLIVKTHGSMEAWLSKSNNEVVGNFNYEFGASAELRFPRFLLISPSVLSPRYIPDNHIRIDSRYVNQMQFYRMSFFRMSYGYRWAESAYRSHELNLVDITYQHMLGSTNVFDAKANANPLLKQSFSDQFIVGTNYMYQYSVPNTDLRKFKTAFTGLLDLSGNLLYGLQRLSGKKETEEEPLKFLGTTYAQYVKTTTDFRIFWDYARKNQLAARVSAGIGLPVGNSETLPGIKQYYLGGANNLRAFEFRSVGPGAYADSANSDDILINHSGEIMLLGNIENRYRFAKRFELAVFLDAGNIWLVRNDTLRPGAKFNSRSFLNELAVGWGTGLRYLNQFFTIRLDVGFPLHSPNKIKEASDMDAIFNFAIGYPF